MRRALAAAILACCAACGKKGPPLPPLVRLPAAPTDLAAVRRGATVDLSFTVPAANTDGSRPANISRVDVYALTAPVSTSDAVVLKNGARVASAAVKAPRDPNEVAEPDEPSSDVPAPEGAGLDQGVAAHVAETITPADLRPLPRAAAASKSQVPEGPLVGPPLTAPTRLYLALGVNPRGRRGPVSRRVNVPLVDPPQRTSEPAITYDESAIRLAWNAPSEAVPDEDEGVLPSHSLVTTPFKLAFNVYEVPPDSARGPQDVKLTMSPVEETHFADERVEWGRERCYVIRAVKLLDNMSVEGDASPPRCVTPVDTFPPAQPKKPTAIALPGAINILWDANEEPDLAGYLVFRGTAPGGDMIQLTPEPIDRTNYTDEVPANFRAFYAVEAVDKAGNRSAMSPASDEETAL